MQYAYITFETKFVKNCIITK